MFGQERDQPRHQMRQSAALDIENENAAKTALHLLTESQFSCFVKPQLQVVTDFKIIS